jgi:hypothetical protein
VVVSRCDDSLSFLLWLTSIKESRLLFTLFTIRSYSVVLNGITIVEAVVHAFNALKDASTGWC